MLVLVVFYPRVNVVEVDYGFLVESLAFVSIGFEDFLYNPLNEKMWPIKIQ